MVFIGDNQDGEGRSSCWIFGWTPYVLRLRVPVSTICKGSSNAMSFTPDIDNSVLCVLMSPAIKKWGKLVDVFREPRIVM